MTDSSKEASPIPLWLMALAVLVVIALVTFAWVIGRELVAGKQKADTGSLTTTTPAASDDGPLSILPREAGGVTVVEKQPEAVATPAIVAPIAAGAAVASGYAMDLGAAVSFIDLTARFHNIEMTNGPENFVRLEPRAVLRETDSGLEARLLVGPFDTENAAEEACSALELPDDLQCQPVLFEGEIIPRE